MLSDWLREIRFKGKGRLLDPLTPRTGLVTPRVFGCRMTLDLADWIQRSIYMGTYERRETALFRKYLSLGDTVVDVGANVGYFTALGAQSVGATGRVIAIEPSPYAFERLNAMIASNHLGRCVAFPVGVSDAAGELCLYRSPDSTNHTPTMVAHGDSGFVYAKVPVRTLDEILDEAKVDRVDLMKIDVEGFEPQVLRGCRAHLASGQVKAILLEFNETWLKQNGSSGEDLHGLLNSFGFKLASKRTETVETCLYLHA